MNKKLNIELEHALFEILCELNAPVTDDLSVEYMQDSDKVQEAYQEMMLRIEKYFVEHYEVEEVLNSADK